MAKRETWERRGFSNPLKLTGVDYTILGVMPPNFHGLDDSTQLWVPMTTMGARLAADYPPTNPNYSADAAPLRDEFFGNLRQPLIVLLGAGRGALARLFTAEAFALAFGGPALGVLLAGWLIAALEQFAPIELPGALRTRDRRTASAARRTRSRTLSPGATRLAH